MNMRKKIIAFIVLMCILHICYGEDNDISTKRSGRGQNEKQRAHKHYIHQRHFNDDDWIDSLIWNLIGYSTVLVPAFAILRMAKYSNFNEREGISDFTLSVYRSLLLMWLSKKFCMPVEFGLLVEYKLFCFQNPKHACLDILDSRGICYIDFV